MGETVSVRPRDILIEDNWFILTGIEDDIRSDGSVSLDFGRGRVVTVGVTPYSLNSWKVIRGEAELAEVL